MMGLGEDIYKLFGEVKFGEIDNMCLNDFNRGLNRYMSKKKIRHGRYKFGEINNNYINDFEESFNSYFY